MSNRPIPKPRWAEWLHKPTMCYSRRPLTLALCDQKYRQLGACLRTNRACITKEFQAKFACAWHRENRDTRAVLCVIACSVVVNLPACPGQSTRFSGTRGGVGLHLHPPTITNQTYHLFYFTLLFKHKLQEMRRASNSHRSMRNV